MSLTIDVWNPGDYDPDPPRMPRLELRGKALIEHVGIPLAINHGKPLTLAEREVVAMLALGYSYKTAGAATRRSKATIATYAKHAIAKAGARNRTHLVALALRESLRQASDRAAA